MITTPHFTIGHLMKTGGDATKQICFAVFEAGLERKYVIDSIFDQKKHRPFDGTEQGVRVLGIRRLPSWLMSFSEHGFTYGGYSQWTPEECASSDAADTQLKLVTADLKYLPVHWLRMERLRADLQVLLLRIYGSKFEKKHELILKRCPTKQPMNYDHCVERFYTRWQLQRVYENNPIWARYEKAVYGNTLDEKN